jgi:hypothetical protein
MHHDDAGDSERHSAFLRPWPDAKAAPETEGVMLAAVNRDLSAINAAEVPGGYTYAAIAVYLAQVIDSRGKDDGPSVTAKLADQLGRAMAALTKRGGTDDDGFERFTDAISEPVVE